MSFGSYAAWLSVCTIGAVVSTGRLEASLALSSDGREREVALSSCASTIASLGLCLGLSLAATGVFLEWPEGVTAPLAVLIPAGVLTIASSQTILSYSAATGAFRAMSLQRISYALVVAISQIVAGIIDPSPETLAIGFVLGGLFGAVVSTRALEFTDRADALRLHLPRALAHWRLHWRFPAIALPADVTNATAAQLPTLLITAKFGAAAGGAYAMAYRALGAPLSIIGTAALDVFKRSASARYRLENSCREEYLATVRLLVPVALAIAVLGYALVRPVFALAFGSEWQLAGEFAQILVPLFALRLVASPLSFVFYLANAQYQDLAWQLALLCVTWTTLSRADDLKSGLGNYALAYGTMYVIYLVMSYRLSKGSRA